MPDSKNYNIDGKKIDENDYLNVVITDFKLHARQFRNPNSLGRQYEKAIHGGKARRAYSNNMKVNNKGLELEIDLDKEKLAEMVRKTGKKYVRILFPKQGIPVYPADDFKEKLIALEKKFQKRYK